MSFKNHDSGYYKINHMIQIKQESVKHSKVIILFLWKRHKCQQAARHN
jgi:hypothetical protein